MNEKERIKKTFEDWERRMNYVGEYLTEINAEIDSFLDHCDDCPELYEFQNLLQRVGGISLNIVMMQKEINIVDSAGFDVFELVKKLEKKS